MSLDDSEDTGSVSEFKVLRRIADAKWQMSVRGHKIPAGVGGICSIAIIAGALCLVDGLRAGDSGTSALGALFLACGVVPMWLLLTWRVYFGSDNIINGFWVWRGHYAMSSALPYQDIERIEFEDLNRFSSRVTLSSKNNAYSMAVTEGGTEIIRLALVFLSQRVDKSVFDEKALQMLETGRLDSSKWK